MEVILNAKSVINYIDSECGDCGCDDCFCDDSDCGNNTRTCEFCGCYDFEG